MTNAENDLILLVREYIVGAYRQGVFEGAYGIDADEVQMMVDNMCAEFGAELEDGGFVVLKK